MVSPRFVKNTLIFYIFPSEYFRNFYRPSYKMPKDNYPLFKASIKNLGYNNQYLNIFLIVLFGKGMNVDLKKKKIPLPQCLRDILADPKTFWQF